MTRGVPEQLVLAVYPSSKGVAFVLFEGPDNPFDWGIKEIKGATKNRTIVESVERIIVRFQPDVLVIEETRERGSRRTPRIRKLYQSLQHVAAANVIDVVRYPKSTVRQTFSRVGASTKYEIAHAIAQCIPAFAPRLPRVRKPWMSQDSRQSLFDAAALAITYYAHRFPSPYAVDDAP